MAESKINYIDPLKWKGVVDTSGSLPWSIPSGWKELHVMTYITGRHLIINLINEDLDESIPRMFATGYYGNSSDNVRVLLRLTKSTISDAQFDFNGSAQTASWVIRYR